MRKYVTRRLLIMLPTMLLASLIIFAILRIMPGDAALAILGRDDRYFTEQDYLRLRAQLGLDDPLVVQYGKWLWQLGDGSFGGDSLARTTMTVWQTISYAFPATILLSIYALTIAVIVAIPFGIIAALYQDRWQDYLVRVITISGLSMPHFWVGLITILALLLLFGWVPPTVYSHPWQDPKEHFQLMIWPALTLSWSFSALITRVTRANVLDVLRSDYIRTARSKGLAERVVLFRHALRNALIPVVTLCGIYFGGLLAGTVVMEIIFNIPGLGFQLLNSINLRDLPVTQSLAALFVAIMLVVNLLVDITYSWIDPRVSYQ